MEKSDNAGVTPLPLFHKKEGRQAYGPFTLMMENIRRRFARRSEHAVNYFFNY